jgi:hypothetical protein
VSAQPLAAGGGQFDPKRNFGFAEFIKKANIES